MMSLGTIVAINEEIAAEAAKKGKVPFVPFSTDVLDSIRRFPNLGYHAPLGWQKTGDEWFVDKTGHGHESDPALTIRRFREVLREHIAAHPAHGFAITEEGLFQVVISAFEQTA